MCFGSSSTPPPPAPAPLAGQNQNYVPQAGQTSVTENGRLATPNVESTSAFGLSSPPPVPDAHPAFGLRATTKTQVGDLKIALPTPT